MSGLLEDAFRVLSVPPRYEYGVTTTFAGLRQLSEDWQRLFVESGTTNGFAHPEWLTAWAEHYLEEADLCVLTLRDRGELVAVAPFHRVRRPDGPELSRRLVPHARVLRQLGTGHGTGVTELPEILTRDPQTPKVMRAVVRGLLDHVDGWDWVELTLTPDQGWFDTEWIVPAGQRSDASVVHLGTRACVVLSLQPSWDLFRASLSRNVRESIRRAENRLRRSGHEWRLVDEFPDAEAVEVAFRRLSALHRARSLSDRGPRHANQLRLAETRSFVEQATVRMSASGHATPSLLEVDGEVVAARLLLHAGASTFFSVSGFEPGWWDFGVATTLLTATLRSRIERGDVVANLSTTPDPAKLRWSRELRLHQDFALVRSERRARTAFGVQRIARAARLLPS